MVSCPLEGCGREFETEHAMKTHYGRSHEGSIAGEPKTCPTCGDEFRTPPSHDAEYCSVPCKDKGRRGGETKTCPQCGDSFYAYPSQAHRRTFCSHSCAADDMQERYNVPRRVELTCKWCGEEYVLPPSLADGSNFCARECLSAWQSENVVGEAHHGWRGGYDQYVYGWPKARKEALRLAGFACESCGVTDSDHRDKFGFGLDVHHITPLLDYEGDDPHNLDNLAALCRACHSEAEEAL